MYKKLLYNHNNCILDTESNKVIFSDFKRYNDYLEWKNTNPELEKELTENKDIELRWNLGAPHKDKDSEGNEILTHYYPTGTPHKIEQINPSGGKIVTLFNKINKVISKTTTVDDIIDQEVFDSFGRVIEVNKYNKGELILLQLNDYEKRLKIYNQKGVRTLEVSYYDSELKQEHISKTRRGNAIIFNEYFRNGQLRSTGKLNQGNQMTGVWRFYHQNGNLASSHRFIEGSLTKKSVLYREDGTLNLEIEHN